MSDSTDISRDPGPAPNLPRRNPALLDAFRRIQKLLASLKPRFNPPTVEIIDDLKELAQRAETYGKLRGADGEGGEEGAEEVDRAGVELWNVTVFSGAGEGNGVEAKVKGAMRHAAFRMLEAGSERPLPPRPLARMLQLATKAASALSSAGELEMSARLLESAAQYQDWLSAIHPGPELDPQTKASAVAAYYACRCEVAWKQGNETVASFMLGKATDDNTLAAITVPEIELLAALARNIGKTVLKTTRGKPGEESGAVDWLQRALRLMDRLEGEGEAGVRELKADVMKLLAVAYIRSSATQPAHLDQAEATLDELLGDMDDSTAEAQKIRSMKLSVLKKRDAGEADLEKLLKKMAEHMDFNETALTQYLSEVHPLADSMQGLVTSVLQHLLLAALGRQEGHPFVDRILLSLIINTKGELRPRRGIQDIGQAFDAIREQDIFSLSKTASAACQTLLWQVGDKLFATKQLSYAAEFYLLGCHAALRAARKVNFARCYRKAALCYIRLEEFPKASEVVRRSSSDEAANSFVLFLAASKQGLEDEAAKAIMSMTRAPDFDGRMLLLATQHAHDAGLKDVLAVALKEILQRYQKDGTIGTEVDVLVLLRCLGRTCIEQLEKEDVNQLSVIDSIVQHYELATELADRTVKAGARDTASAHKELLWLYESAYNCACQGCQDWPANKITRLLEITLQLMDLYRKHAPSGSSPELEARRCMTTFALLSARVFAVREGADGRDRNELLERLSNDIPAARELIRKTLDSPNNRDDEKLRQVDQILLIYRAEVLCRLGMWNEMTKVVKESTQAADLPPKVLESLADLVWQAQPRAPVEVVVDVLEAVLGISVERSIISTAKFARFMRSIVETLLARQRSTDRTRAAHFVSQANEMLLSLASHGVLERYPVSEIDWLLAKAWNESVTCFSASLLEAAKLWFELSTSLCRHATDGERRIALIQRHYAKLLAKYAAPEQSAMVDET